MEGPLRAGQNLLIQVAGIGATPGSYFQGWGSFAAALEKAREADAVALAKLRGGDVQAARGWLSTALLNKRKALAALPLVKNLGCGVTREGGGQSDVSSFKVDGCTKPLTGIVLSSRQPVKVFGSSVLPGERHAACKQISPMTVFCEVKPALKPGEQAYLDVMNPPPPGMVQVTTCTTSGHVTGCWTKTG